MKHTKGPWKLSGKRLIHADGYRVANILSERDGFEANAALIASAPEMLEALESLINCPDLNLESLEPETIEAIQNAGQAINKAKGE